MTHFDNHSAGSSESLARSTARTEPLLLVLTALALLPIAGIVFGAASMIWGVAKHSRSGNLLALISACFIFLANFVSILVFFSLINTQPALLQKIAIAYAQESINALAISVEEHRAKFGRYPDSLQQLHLAQTPGVVVTIIDPIEAVFRKRRIPYYYQSLPQGRYYLRSSGVGGVIFNNDDILPELPPTLQAKSGLALSPN